MFEYRGFMLDSVRHWQDIEEIKKLIDALAILGFNRFHWHLTDDQGWRFQSEKYPVLNTVSAFRDYSDFGKKIDHEKYGRIYTKQEMTDIVLYCKNKGIDVIPEFEMPGHTSALLAAFPELSCNNEQVKIKTHQGIFKDVLCPAKEKTFETVIGILDEICSVFPYEYIHIGGDETPYNHWKNCPDCRKLMEKENITDFAEYQNLFMNKVIDCFESKGIHCIVWNDAAKGKNLDKRATIQYWHENHKPSIDFINNGGKAILSPFSYFYLDYSYKITPLNRVYSFNPYLKGLTEKGRKNIIGVEATLWTEYIDNNQQLEKMIFPRLIAVSKIAKGSADKPYKTFLSEIDKYISTLNNYSFEEKSKWTKTRLSMPLGWLEYVKNNYTLEFIKSQIK